MFHLYPTFFQEKHFCVQKPTIQDRDACAEHTNMELMLLKLKQLSVIKEKSLHNVLNSVCCFTENEKCMQITCDICKERPQILCSKKIDHQSHAIWGHLQPFLERATFQLITINILGLQVKTK